MIGLSLIIAFVIAIILFVVFIFCACIVGAKEDERMEKDIKKRGRK